MKQAQQETRPGDAAYDFVQFIVQTRFEDLPPEVVDIEKKSILDILGVILAGSSTEEIAELYQLVTEWGGRQESTVLAFGGRFPADNAAFINAAMGHAPEADDTYWEAGLHPSCVVVPSALAVSEVVGGVGGRDFLTAACIATELGCRIGRAATLRRPEILMGGWTHTAICGFFEAASMGKLLGLDSTKIHNALGLAFMQAAGNQQCIRDGALTKRMGPGFAARGGLTALFMARKGITGAKEIFETGTSSYFPLYHAGCDRDILVGGLGKEYLMAGLDLKPHYCCLINFAPVDATLQLMKENKISPQEIEEITVRSYPHAEVVCYPPETKKRPRTIADAQFSIPWTVACAAVRGRVSRNEFTGESLKDPALLRMAARVDAGITSSLKSMEHSNVKMRTRRGDFETTVLHPYGTTDNPMSFDDVARKFLDFSNGSVKSISARNKKAVIDMVKNLEEVRDVTELVKLLT